MSFFRGPNGRILVSADIASRFLRRFYAYIWGEGKRAFLDLPQGARIRSAAYHWYRPDSRPGTKNRPSIGAIETIAFWSGIPVSEWIGDESSLRRSGAKSSRVSLRPRLVSSLRHRDAGRKRLRRGRRNERGSIASRPDFHPRRRKSGGLRKRDSPGSTGRRLGSDTLTRPALSAHTTSLKDVEMNRFDRVKDFIIIRDEIEGALDQIYLFAQDGCPEDSLIPAAIAEIEARIKGNLESIEIIVGDLYGEPIENE